MLHARGPRGAPLRGLHVAASNAEAHIVIGPTEPAAPLAPVPFPYPAAPIATVPEPVPSSPVPRLRRPVTYQTPSVTTDLSLSVDGAALSASKPALNRVTRAHSPLGSPASRWSPSAHHSPHVVTLPSGVEGVLGRTEGVTGRAIEGVTGRSVDGAPGRSASEGALGRTTEGVMTRAESVTGMPIEGVMGRGVEIAMKAPLKSPVTRHRPTG